MQANACALITTTTVTIHGARAWTHLCVFTNFHRCLDFTGRLPSLPNSSVPFFLDQSQLLLPCKQTFRCISPLISKNCPCCLHVLMFELPHGQTQETVMRALTRPGFVESTSLRRHVHLDLESQPQYASIGMQYTLHKQRRCCH